MNLLRWVNARTVKENFVPPHTYGYPTWQRSSLMAHSHWRSRYVLAASATTIACG
jgi:hypothetical protein